MLASLNIYRKEYLFDVRDNAYFINVINNYKCVKYIVYDTSSYAQLTPRYQG